MPRPFYDKATPPAYVRHCLNNNHSIFCKHIPPHKANYWRTMLSVLRSPTARCECYARRCLIAKFGNALTDDDMAYLAAVRYMYVLL